MTAAAAPVRVALISSGEIYGGVERFISTYAAFLAEGGLGVPVAILYAHGRLAAELKANRVPVHVCPFRKYNPRAASWTAGILRDEMIDIVHAHGYKGSILGGLAARMARIPAVKTEHGALEPFSGLAALKMRLNSGLDRIVTHRFFEEAAYITVDLMGRRRISGRRGARVIANGISPVLSGREKVEVGGREFRIGIVGRLSPVKGHSTLFSAIEKARARDRLRIDVFGTGPLESGLRQAAGRLPPGAVTFHGFREDILSSMARLDCLAMPSMNEGMPYTLLEAMHLGLPIVASRVGGMREILKDGRTALLFEAGDSDALARCLDALVDDPDLAGRIGESAKADARERFAIDRMAQSYVNLYREVM